MPDDAPTSTSDGASLDDLERRLASFENATKRLNRTVGGIADPEPTAAPGHTSPPRPATRRLSESGAPRGEEISGLRPAVQLQGPQTGALTARARGGSGPVAGTPGFTSAFGKPAIPAPPPQTAAQRQASGPPPRAISLYLGRIVLIIVALGFAALLLALVVLTRSFRELPDGTIMADSTQVKAPGSGVVRMQPLLRVGEAVTAGGTIAQIGETPVPAPHDGIIARMLVTPDARIAAGEMVAEIARPESLRVVLPLAANLDMEQGERVSVRLGQGRTCGGMVESILKPGEQAFRSPSSPLRRAIIVLDPSPTAPQLDQSARVTRLGSREPGPLTLALFALRRMLPW